MRRRATEVRAGFTLIELMIVIAIVALVVAIAIPNLLEARKNANEGAAIAGLRAIQSAQAIHREKYEDAAAGTLAYGWVRSPTQTDLLERGLLTGFLPDSAGGTSTASFAVKQGFRYYGQPSSTPQDRPYRWLALAWPIARGATGEFRYATNHTGVIFAHRDWDTGLGWNQAMNGWNVATCELDPGFTPPDGQPYVPVGR